MRGEKVRGPYGSERIVSFSDEHYPAKKEERGVEKSELFVLIRKTLENLSKDNFKFDINSDSDRIVLTYFISKEIERYVLE